MNDKRQSDGGARILTGLNEAVAWASSDGKAIVHFPGEPGRVMTRQEYEMECILRLQQRDAPRLLPKRPKPF